ncbi:probable cytochrome P450 4d14 [Aethina tumida]|uniref:probable cytochrome P450 4d14 n=1 Tax=Aethina tumida TaxID=116153 RepID=UPI0021480B1C|nr:probable cytochrome P450 4d14 [Aethina tumida]
MIFEICVTILVGLWIYYNILEQKHREKYKKFYALPTPKTLPLIGNIHYGFNEDNLLGIIQSLVKDGGNPCVLYLPKRNYLTSNPEELKIILNHPNALDKSFIYDTLREVFQSSLLMTDVTQWKKNRKMISKGFNQVILDSFVDVFYEKSCILIDILRKFNIDGDNMFHLFERYTLETFCEATLGVESSLLTDNDTTFVKAITEGQRMTMARLMSLIQRNDFIFKHFYKKGKILIEIKNYVMDFVQNIIDKKRIAMGEDNYIFNKNKLPVLDLLLENYEKKNLTDQYIKEEMTLFAGAATDTTAYSMAYTCCLLAMHPEVQEKVYKEAMDIVGQDRIIDCNDLIALKYTEMAINEALRLLPVVPIIGRQATADINLGEMTIPKNTGIFIYIFALHRDPKIYSNPLKYDPNRFSPEEIAKRPQYSFIPFSGGPRNCIGWKYAMMIMKMTIANIVRNFKITTKHKSVEEFEFESSIVMNMKYPMDCHFHPR